MRWLLLALAIVSGCTTATSSPPAIDDAANVDLQVRAIIRACENAMCGEDPIYVSDEVSDRLRSALVDEFGDQVVFPSMEDSESRVNQEGQYDPPATSIEVEPVASTNDEAIVGVNVWTSRGTFDGFGQTYLFVWTGTAWADTTPGAPDSGNVTVTTAVS